MDLIKALKTYTQFESFKPGQREVISSILQGNDTVAVLPTGTGKSLCYQLPGYLLPGKVLIVTPLLSLMQDQVEQMAMRGEKGAVAINSFLSPVEKKKVFNHLDQYKYIFISPEMLNMDFILSRLIRLPISLFVIDEAHCISQWGYDFRPDYMKLGEVKEKLHSPLTLALTATATKKVVRDITQSLRLEQWNEFISSVDRPNIAMKVEKVQDFQGKKNRTVQLVTSLKGPGIIYFSSKRLAEEMAVHLKENGVHKVSAYHGGMSQEDRILIQQQFINGQLDLVCATSAFGMGINKENVRYVIHFHLPLQLESYLQEIGRAGRDGKPSIAILLYSERDEELSLGLIEGELPNSGQIDWLYHEIQTNKQLFDTLANNASEIYSYIGASEIQWRIMNDFLIRLSQNPSDYERDFEDFKIFIQKRIEAKKRNVYELVRWLHSDLCRREYILSNFDEQLKTKIDPCCDRCGIELHSFQMEDKSSEAVTPFNWKSYLKELF